LLNFFEFLTIYTLEEALERLGQGYKMRIEDRMRIFQIYTQTANTSKVEKKKERIFTDKIEISSEARDFQAILNAIKLTPDVREEKVNEIKKKIDSGIYNISGRDVVEKLIREYKASKKSE